MKAKFPLFLVVAFATVISGCSDDNEVKRKGDPDLQHTGEKWTITSIEYTLLEQGVSGTSVQQTFKQGTKANAGTFYFISGESRGSFELEVEGYNKEDVFSYDNADGSVSMFQISQSVGVTTNQNVIEISGSSTETEMALSGLVVKQSTTSQFTLEVHSLTLTKAAQ